MFEKYKQYWNDYGLETLAILSIIIIIVLFIYNWFTNKKGTYSQKPISKFNLPPKDSFYNYRQHTVRDSKLELLTKNHLETIFQKPFFKIRPEFLKNESSGRNLEIDLFNKDIGLAVEIQGIQHYKFTPRFHLTPHQFSEQQQRDQKKALKCRQYGIKLIEVPYNIKERDLYQFLIQKLKQENLL
jgi:hypothetical protein